VAGWRGKASSLFTSGKTLGIKKDEDHPSPRFWQGRGTGTSRTYGAAEAVFSADGLKIYLVGRPKSGNSIEPFFL
jgi:hypothetical protein